MTLLKCPGCGYPVVSSEAKSCPRCGAPIASEEIATPLAAVQQTRKSLRSQGWIAAVILIVGFTLLAFNDYNSPTGWLMALIGAGWAFITRIRIWWHHD